MDKNLKAFFRAIITGAYISIRLLIGLGALISLFTIINPTFWWDLVINIGLVLFVIYPYMNLDVLK